MIGLFAMPLPIRLTTLLLLGACFGAVVNWAIYRFAWQRRNISPWLPQPDGVSPRTWSDRIPIFGWLRLRREAPIHGRGFWIRPLLVELALAVGLAWLYWWEVVQQRMILDLALVAGGNQLIPLGTWAPGWTAPSATVHAIFLSHSLLILLMVAASFIDIDEKIIPDEVAVTGTLVGLILAALLPISLLPHVGERAMPPPLGQPLVNAAGAPIVGPNGPPLYLEHVTATAPAVWPDVLGPAPNWRSLLIGFACYWLWCFALTTRIWRGRRGAATALRIIAARVRRELCQPPLAWIALLGTAMIAAVWWWGEQSWIGLLSALIAMAATGAFVWAVRIACSTALRVEALGFGDVTLMMMIATFLGWQAGILIFFIAPLAGLVVGLVQYAIIRDNVIPYGPFLCLAAAIVAASWAAIWNRAEPLFAVGWLVPAVLAICLVLMWAMLTLWHAIKRRIF